MRTSIKLRAIAVFGAIALTLAFGSASWGQILKGSISGTVVDPQSAVVSGAQIKATGKATGAVFNTTSGSAGEFRLNAIPVGQYRLEVAQQGFKTAVVNNVEVSAGVDTSQTVQLTVGERTETVEVTIEAPLIETTQAQVTNTFSTNVLQSFAGIQENQGLDNLALFVPGVTSLRDADFSNTNGGSGFSVNGLRGRNNDQEIDGQNNNDNSVAGPGLFLSDTEFVQQYVLITNNFGPEYGRNAGSVVNIITKSGTNNWHGSIYGTENNSVMNSRTNFQTNPAGSPVGHPPRLNNEFGGFTVGGPIIKNKAFFFGGFDEQLIATLGTFSSGSLTPTPAGLAQLNACFPGSTALQAFTKIGPYAFGGNPQPFGGITPVTVGACANVPFSGVERFASQPTHNFNWITRVDYQLGSRDNVSARYIFNRGNVFNTDAFGTGAAGFPANVPALSQAILVSETHNFGAHMVNEIRAGFDRLNVEFGGNSLGSLPTDAGLDQAFTRVTFLNNSPAGIPFLSMGPATNAPQGRIVNTWQVQDNWSYVMGKHTLKAGVNFTYQRSPNIFLPTINGSYRFADWSQFVINNPNRVRVGNGASSLDFREYDTFLYVGDDWKIGQNLTLNLGLTWTYYGQPENLLNDITTKRESNPATAFWKTSLPLSVRTDPSIPTVNNSFGPSLGFAYTPKWGGFLTGHGKTTFRGGYRFLYDPPFYNIYLNVSTSAPAVFLNTVPAPGTHPIPTVPTGPNVRASLAPFLTPGVQDPRNSANVNVSPNFGPDKVHSWSLGFERELTKNAVFEARYSGNRAYNLFESANGNPFIADLKTDFPNLVPSGLTPCPAASAAIPSAVGRIDCNNGILLTRNNQGYSYYNALQVEFRANNLFKQLTLRTAYTYSKTLDNVSEIFSTFGGGNSLTLAQNPVNPTKGEYSYSGLDVPNQWSILFSEQIPFFKEQHGAIGHILGGWGFAGNYVIASGQRYTPIQAFEEANFTSCFGIPTTCKGTSNGNYYDGAFLGNFAGVDLARPFIGSVTAPATSVGVFALDACNNFGLACAAAPNQLISMNALNATAGPTVVNVTNKQVRYIINGGEAQSIFGTPFGTAARNLSQDAPTNVANFSIFKTIKMNERATFQFHATALNVFNHANYQTIDVFAEDAGVKGSLGTGFGDPKVQNTSPFFYSAPANRILLVGGTIRW
jgi:hypothetical protein